MDMLLYSIAFHHMAIDRDATKSVLSKWKPIIVGDEVFDINASESYLRAILRLEVDESAFGILQMNSGIMTDALPELNMFLMSSSAKNTAATARTKSERDRRPSVVETLWTQKIDAPTDHSALRTRALEEWMGMMEWKL